MGERRPLPPATGSGEAPERIHSQSQVFLGQRARSAEDNIRYFIDGMRSASTVFGGDLDFEHNVWDVTHHVRRRASDARIRLYFIELDPDESGAGRPLSEPFLSFAKALIRYFHGTHPTKQPQHRLTALRALYRALVECTGTCEPMRISTSVLDSAAQILSDTHVTSSVYRYGSMLVKTADFLDEHCLCSARLAWRNPFKAVWSVDRVGPEFEALRQKRLPSRAALEAIAKAYRLAKTDEDVAYSSVTLLLCSCPSRVSEWLTAPLDIEAKVTEAGNDRLLRLRWYPSKNGRPTTKIIPGIMVDLVQQALRNLRRIGARAREVARWYEEHPGQLWLPPELERIRGHEFISMDQARKILGPWSFLDFLRKEGIRLERRGHKRYLRLVDLERAVLSTLPPGFPTFDATSGIKFSEALCVSLHNQLRAKRVPWFCSVDRIGEDQLRKQHGAYEPRIPSLFSRFGCREADGSPIRLQSHMLRRYSNTIAKKAGLSDRDIQLWSDRKTVRQNDPYDLESPRDMLARLRSKVANPHTWRGSLGGLPSNLPMTREEFAALSIPFAHTTELGYCIHDFTMLPCLKRRKCLRCTEHVCVKGEEGKTEAIRAQLIEGRKLVALAKAGQDRKSLGANRWFEFHSDTVARLESLLSILEDPEVPPGTAIQLGSPAHPLPPGLRLPLADEPIPLHPMPKPKRPHKWVGQ